MKSTVAYTDIPPGALITFLQKGLEYVGIEEHINEVTPAAHHLPPVACHSHALNRMVLFESLMGTTHCCLHLFVKLLELKKKKN